MFGVGIVLLFLSARAADGLIFQSSVIDQAGAVNFTMQVSSSQSECASLLARGDIEFIDAILNFDPNGTPYASASDMFVQVKLLNENSDVLSCFQYGGYDFETTDCGIAGKWPTEWGTTLGTYRYTANVSKVSASGENWFICVGNGWTQASGSVSYSGQLIFPPSLTYDLPSTSSPSLLPSLSPTRSPTLTSTATTSPSRTPTLSPSSSHPTVTLSPTSDPIYLNADCDAPLFIEYDAQLSGGQSVCIDFGANGSFSTFSLQLNFTGSSSNSEKASDFGFVLYSTHFHTGVQYGGYNYYLDNVDYISGWPESWNSRVSGSYFIEDQVVNINPSFNINGDYYRLCIFNGWSSASKATYVGSIDLSNSLHLNCDVIEPDLTPTLTPTPQPTVTLGPTSVTDRGIYLSPLSSHPLDPLTFLFDVNLTSAGYLCSPAIPSTGYLTSISTVFDFTPANEISWASDLLVTIRMLPSDSSTAGEECVVVGGEDVDSQSTCQTPQAVYSWSSKALESNHEGTYNATVELTGWTTDPATYQVCLTNGFAYDDGSLVSYRGLLSLKGLFIPPDYPSSSPTSAPTVTQKKSNADDDNDSSLTFEAVLLMAILIPVGVAALLFVGYLVFRWVRTGKTSSANGNEALINSNQA